MASLPSPSYCVSRARDSPPLPAPPHAEDRMHRGLRLEAPSVSGNKGLQIGNAFGAIIREFGTAGIEPARAHETAPVWGVVQPPRLERGTPRSTIWCSNQLSYGCT